MGYRYIGSKARIADEILSIISAHSSIEQRFVDGFCGTGIVSSKAADLGFNVLANDMMSCATIMTISQLLSKSDVPFKNLQGYSETIDILNNLDGTADYFTHNYSPESLNNSQYERKYFSVINAKKIDAILNQIKKWFLDNVITENEKNLLLNNLIIATNSIANIAGTYGCFLSKWTAQSKNTLKLECTKLRTNNINFKILNDDIFNMQTEKNDILYLDPPYTKRQYASYYHIPETIVKMDKPIIDGVAGLRPWKEKASVFCYKTKALKALNELVQKQEANSIYLSYSNDGHVKLEDLETSLSKVGKVTTFNLGMIDRYTPNVEAQKNKQIVTEYLLEIKKD